MRTPTQRQNVQKSKSQKVKILTFGLLGIVTAGVGAYVHAVPPEWEASTGSLQDTWTENPFSVQQVEAGPPVPLAINNDMILASSGDFSNTGGDNCNEAMVVPVPVGPPESPFTVTITGNSGNATGPDCGGALPNVWWEAFQIDACANVSIDFCETAPLPRFGNPTLLADACEPDGTSCGSFQEAASTSNLVCPKGNIWMTFTELPPGTYYYPILDLSLGPLPGGSPYRLNISAEQCEGACEGCFGACCDTSERSCTDNASQEECTGPDQNWLFRTKCCEIECRPADVEFDASGVELLSWISIEQFPSNPHKANDIWGYVSPAGREYAIIGFTTGTGFVDVTDPRNPVIVDVVDGGVDTTARDMAVFGQYAYIVSGGIGVGLQIVDLTDIDNGVVSLVNMSDLGSAFVTAHNVYINPDSGFLYLCIPNLNGGLGLTVVDLTNPINPVIAGFWTDTMASVRCHDVQVVSYSTGPFAGREIAFCFAENDGLKIADVTDKNNMFTLSTLVYPNTTYTHQGWLSEDRRYVFIDDELDEVSNPNVTETTTYVVDVQDLDNPVFATSFTSGLCTRDHNLMVRGSRVYEANYASGLRVFDVSDLSNVEQIAFFDTHPDDNDQNSHGAWGVFIVPSGTVLVSDRQRGLFVLGLTADIPPPGTGDCNGDGDVEDFAIFQTCFTGADPGAPGIGESCHCADFEGNGDVGPTDYATFHAALTGPTGP